MAVNPKVVKTSKWVGAVAVLITATTPAIVSLLESKKSSAAASKAIKAVDKSTTTNSGNLVDFYKMIKGTTDDSVKHILLMNKELIALKYELKMVNKELVYVNNKIKRHHWTRKRKKVVDVDSAAIMDTRDSIDIRPLPAVKVIKTRYSKKK